MAIATNVQLRNDVAAAWAAANPVLLLGEPGLETDTGKFKVGDGSLQYNDLPYFVNIGATVLLEYESTSLPSSATTGSIVWLSDLKLIAYYNGTGWYKIEGTAI